MKQNAEPKCRGCTTATDVGMSEYEPYVVNKHPECPVHGTQATRKRRS